MFESILGGKGKSTIIIIVVVVIIGIFVFVYFMGRRSGKVKIQQVPLPTDQPGGYKLSDADAQSVRSISEGLHTDMKGFNLWGHDLTQYQKLMASNDTIFVAVYNDFNNLFGGEGDGTLRDWLNGEVGTWFNPNYELLRKGIVERMNRLALK
jgi:hypothetical protein